MATILIVDDLPANRELLVTLLRYQGHRLVEAANGQEGLAAVRAERPDLVITDVLMPVMDGYELIRELRLDPATRDVPVVFYTAHYAAREARALALSSGVSEVLTKPAEPEEVLKVVARVLSGGPKKGLVADVTPLTPAFDREHVRLLTDQLSTKATNLRAANARLRGLINIGLDLTAERDADRRLQSVCASARDLFGASYVTLGILEWQGRTLQHLVTCGVDAPPFMATGDAVPGVLATVVAERRTSRGQNPGGDPARLNLPSSHPEIQAFLAVPIASTAHVYGWICLVSNEGAPFTEDDEQLVVTLAGQIGRMYELEHEILERKQAEAALRHEGDRAQRYLDTADIILLALDLDGRITLVNRYACAALGWTADELLGLRWAETCVPARLRDAVTKKFGEVLSGDLSITENTVLTRSGDERLIEWRNTVLRDDAGQAAGTFSSGTDVTERHQAVEALRTAEERMRFALEAAGVGIWDMDYTTGALRWSETLEAQYGLQPGTFGGTFQAFAAGMHPEDREAALRTFQTAAQSGADFSVQNRSVSPDGTVRWLSGAGRIHLGDHGQPVRGVGISQDVTERRALEAQYQQAQKMEAIGRLAGGIAHDFNNLLTAILGYCELLLVDLDPKDPRRADVGEIHAAGTSAAGLTRQLLAFSRKEIIEPTLLDLNVVVANMQGMLGRLIGEDVRIVLNLRPELALVIADRGQLEQVVMNLALNARDAMPLGGTLTIETANVDLDEDYPKTHFAVNPGAYVALTVTDTGSGMTPQVQARLFEPFFTTKEVGRGTGLGLPTVHGIVTRSGGTVNVYSEVGRGTSFRAYFPRADAGGRVADTRPPDLLPLATQSVLVVEDEATLRELTRRLLQRQGYTVLVAANAEEALQICDENVQIDVVLTDVVMPGTSGPELIRQLAARRPGVKIVYMSGYTEDAIVHHGVLNPGIAFINKPFSSDALGRKIRDVLDRSAPVTL
jgi:two-component system, cell cycle sensor histidine kinase and response regulator CckA